MSRQRDATPGIINFERYRNHVAIGPRPELGAAGIDAWVRKRLAAETPQSAASPSVRGSAAPACRTVEIAARLDALIQQLEAEIDQLLEA